jgi:iron complex transport system ATP-binding protein
MKLKVEELTTTIDQKKIIESVNLCIQEGDFVGIIGPNGSGKSTLLKTIYRILEPDAGLISLDQENIQQLSHRVFSQRLAVVSQEGSVPFDFSVKEIVLMGRSPHKNYFERETAQDLEKTSEALSKVGLTGYEERSFPTLSGGEKQRVLIARAFAQDASFLVLDEPTNHLDIHHQLHMLDVIRASNVTILTALHDLNLAAAYCDKLFVMKDGNLVTNGTPKQVLTEELLQDVFQVKAKVLSHPETNKVHLMYISDGMSEDVRYQRFKQFLQK